MVYLKKVTMLKREFQQEIGFSSPDCNTQRSVPTQESIDTSVGSRDKLDAKKNKYRQKIFEFITSNNGSTCDEVEKALDLRHQTASCFIRFLTQDGFLRDSGDRRTTRAGRKAIVWVPTK